MFLKLKSFQQVLHLLTSSLMLEGRWSQSEPVGPGLHVAKGGSGYSQAQNHKRS